MRQGMDVLLDNDCVIEEPRCDSERSANAAISNRAAAYIAVRALERADAERHLAGASAALGAAHAGADQRRQVERVKLARELPRLDA